MKHCIKDKFYYKILIEKADDWALDTFKGRWNDRRWWVWAGSWTTTFWWQWPRPRTRPRPTFSSSRRMASRTSALCRTGCDGRWSIWVRHPEWSQTDHQRTGIRVAYADGFRAHPALPQQPIQAANWVRRRLQSVSLESFSVGFFFGSLQNQIKTRPV